MDDIKRPDPNLTRQQELDQLTKEIAYVEDMRWLASLVVEHDPGRLMPAEVQRTPGQTYEDRVRECNEILPVMRRKLRTIELADDQKRVTHTIHPSVENAPDGFVVSPSVVNIRVCWCNHPTGGIYSIIIVISSNNPGFQGHYDGHICDRCGGWYPIMKETEHGLNKSQR